MMTILLFFFQNYVQHVLHDCDVCKYIKLRSRVGQMFPIALLMMTLTSSIDSKTESSIALFPLH